MDMFPGGLDNIINANRSICNKEVIYKQCIDHPANEYAFPAIYIFALSHSIFYTEKAIRPKLYQHNCV